MAWARALRAERMASVMLALALALAWAGSCAADMYLHNPRGSNNRLNERSANRNNANRLFDSQNNNRGGYNVGDKTNVPFNPTDPLGPAVSTEQPDSYDEAFNPKSTLPQQYQLVYYEGSELHIQWTNQHGFGGNENGDPWKLNSNIVIQYMCDTAPGQYYDDLAMTVDVRDGGTTQTPTPPNTDCSLTGSDCLDNIGLSVTSNLQWQNGQHEHPAFYFECATTQRNLGLFTADQYLQGNTMIYTRQNPAGTQYGLECQEERDYYPYWRPSPWRDIAILTDHPEMCPWYQSQSMNVAAKYKCIDPNAPAQYRRSIVTQATQAACVAAGGIWQGFSHNITAPACMQGPWSRDNHLGLGRNGTYLTYTWVLPSVLDLLPNSEPFYGANLGMAFRCALRARYNISTDDYDPWTTTSKQNNNPGMGVRSPVTQNPTVDIGADLLGLRLAINTNQYGRTFQDRSHVFYIRQRPAAWQGLRIVNLGVRGKRGNIVETFPAMEYDFVPTRFAISSRDLIHIQWTGSNTHNNGQPAGDGEAGDTGEGLDGTDRHNIVQMIHSADNYPIALDKNSSNWYSQMHCFDLDGSQYPQGPTDFPNLPCALALSTSGYYRQESDIQTLPPLDPLLDIAPASLVRGIVVKFNAPPSGQTVNYYYMCTRNNNFTNRSQKGQITVSA